MNEAADHVEIDESFVGGPSAQVDAVPVAEELVLIQTATGATHVLNATATVVWQCLDGASTLGEICADLADELGAERTTVLDQVRAIARDLAARGLIDTGGARTPVALEPRAGDPLRAEAATWRAPIGFRLGSQRFGIRTNDEGVRAALSDRLGNAVVGPPEIPDLSLLVGRPRGTIQGAHFLYVRDRLSLRTRTIDRLLRATVRYLHTLAQPDHGLVRIRARVLVGRGATLVTSARGRLPDLTGRPLTALGRQVLDVPYALVDPATATLRNPPMPASEDETLERGEAHDRSDLPVTDLVVLDAARAVVRPGSPGQQAAALTPFLLLDPTRAPGEDLRALLQLADRTHTRAVRGWHEHALAAALAGSGPPR